MSGTAAAKDGRNVGRPEAGGRRVTGLVVYPFKSARGVPVSAWRVDEAGLIDDRRWMVVDEEGAFVSQRTHPGMALLDVRLDDDAVEVVAPGMGPLRLDRAPRDPTGHASVRVWFSDRYAVDIGDTAARWMSEALGRACRVVEAVRPPDQPLLADDGRVRAGFADASPALVVSVASLDHLNRRLDVPLPMARFRPNVVVEGFGPHEEDAWGSPRIGEVPTRGGRPCPRCAITLVDPATGKRGVEPLRTLATYRRNDRGEVDFGVNVSFAAPGTLHVGDAVVD